MGLVRPIEPTSCATVTTLCLIPPVIDNMFNTAGIKNINQSFQFFFQSFLKQKSYNTSIAGKKRAAWGKDKTKINITKEGVSLLIFNFG